MANLDQKIFQESPKMFTKDFPKNFHPSFILQQTIKEEPSLDHSYYINPCFNLPLSFVQHYEETQMSSSQTRTLPVKNLRQALMEMNLPGHWTVQEAMFGLVMSFERKEDADDVFNKMEVAKVLGGPVQVATLPNIQTGNVNKSESRKNVANNFNMARYNVNINQMSPHASPRNYMYQSPSGRLLQPPGPLVIRDVPWSIPTEEIRATLCNQGIQVTSIDRWRQHVRIEVRSIYHYEQLLTEGLNFYNSGRFAVTGERPDSSGLGHSDTGTSNLQQEDVLQCYRCQGFWHVAANCRHLPRCVRCGEPHGVEYCTRARGNPLCCNCSGAHHAAYKNCPVRKNMSQAAPVAFVLARDRPTGSFAEVTANVSSSNPRCML